MNYLVFSVSIAFISWMVGLILNGAIQNSSFYPRLSHFNFVRDKKLNKTLGLQLFKWIVKNTFFKYFNQKIKVESKQTDLIAIRKEMTIAEIGHLIACIFMSAIALYKSISISIVLGLTMMLVNIIMNLYPALLQQENKRRIDMLIARDVRKQQAS